MEGLVPAVQRRLCDAFQSHRAKGVRLMSFRVNPADHAVLFNGDPQVEVFGYSVILTSDPDVPVGYAKPGLTETWGPKRHDSPDDDGNRFPVVPKHRTGDLATGTRFLVSRHDGRFEVRDRLPNGSDRSLGICTTKEEAEILAGGGLSQPDQVNHPEHYRLPDGLEAIQVTRHLNFNVGNAVKYLLRAGRKDPDPTTDLRKAAWYIQDELERIKS